MTSLLKNNNNLFIFILGKPNPWGVKVFVLAGKSGQAYDFIVYQGKTTEFNQDMLKCFGQGATVVLQLMQRVQSEGHYLFFDNYFSTYQLFEIMCNRKINCAGTIRVNRFSNPTFMNDRQMKQAGRGSSDSVSSIDGKIRLVKWLDNKYVFLGSNFVSIDQEDEVERWNKITKRWVKNNKILNCTNSFNVVL